MAQTRELTRETIDDAYRVVLARVGTRWFSPREVRKALVLFGLGRKERKQLYRALDEEHLLDWRWSLCTLGSQYQLALKGKGTAHEFDSAAQ